MHNLARYFIALFIMIVIPVSHAINKKDIPTARVTAISNESSTFTLKFELKNNNILRNNWGLGFFMFHVLAKPNSKFNIKLCEVNRNILEQIQVPWRLQATSPTTSKRGVWQQKGNLNLKENNCVRMKVRPNQDKMIGHINLIVPISTFKLQGNKKYTISIVGLNNIPRNISAMPQQLFFYDFDKNSYTYLNVLPYNSQAYNRESAIKQTESIILENWNHYKTKPISSYVIPTPVKVVYESGFNVGNNVSLVYYCSDSISYNKICQNIKNQPEGYILKIESNHIIIYANKVPGIFYARQTIQQLKYYYGNKLPSQTIIDYPRFKYRGIMLDTVRHFFSITDIKQLLDVMATNKLNTLHLHLADDEGWRIEVKNYRELTQIGSKRGGHSVLPASNLTDEKYDITNVRYRKYEDIETEYQGFYSIKDIESLIHYANERQITIIPEIEMPGHALAMKKSLPKLFTESTDISKYMSIQGYTNNVLPVCKYDIDTKFTNSINNITKNVAKLFNSQKTVYAINNEISLSGDEVPHGAYNGLSYCKYGVFKGLDTEGISHQYFKSLSENMRQYQLSGWQQIIQRDNGDISESIVIPAKQVGHIWVWIPTTNTPTSGYMMASNLLKHNYPIVVNFSDYVYFDLRYASLFDEPGLYWANDYTNTYSAFTLANAVNKLYQEPTLDKAELDNILGVEGSIWTELIPSNEHLWYMILPKMGGLSEAAWAEESNFNWRSLAIKLGCGNRGFLHYLNKKYGVIYRGYPYGISKEVPPGVCP
ncbi:MAG: family 20 glycosylhydrolase [Neisseriaceae bacterium]